MEQYYSSDDDVCWGPPTLREIKRILKRPIDKSDIDRRRTIGFNSPRKSENEEPTPVHEDIKDVIEDVSKLSIKSIYYTPNETMQQDAPNTSKFCNEVSKILNDTQPATFVTAAADLSTDTLMPESCEILDKLKCTIDSIMLTKKNIDKNVPNVTIMGNNVQNSDLIDNFHATLAPIESSEEDTDNEEISNNIEQIIEKLNDDYYSSDEDDVDTALDQQKKSLEVIEISDENSVEELEVNEKYEEVLSLSEEIEIEDDCDINDKYEEALSTSAGIESEEDCEALNEQESTSGVKEKDVESLRFQGTQAQYEDISCVEELEVPEKKSNVSIDSNYDSEVASFEYKHMKKSNAIFDVDAKESINHMTLPQHNISISVSECDDEYNKENDRSDYIFDDTLEEINRALNEGLDYHVPNDEPRTPVAVVHKETTSAKKTSFESKLKPPNEYSVSKIPRQQQLVTPDFKHPLRPARRSPTPLHLRNALSFKEIVSPVAIYIKNSTTPTQKNVAVKMMDQLPKKSVHKSPSTSKQFFSLPEVVYRPANKKCVSKEKEIKFGGKIEKLLVTKPEVIRHEKKFLSKPVNVHKKLQESNLTFNSSNSSLMDATQDVSVLTSKKTFIR